MRDYELDLIAALAEGRLEDEAEARALIEANEEARLEFEAQKLAVDALAGATSQTLSDTERASLRRDVWTELRTPTPVPSTSRPWYYRWMPVAAGLFVIVGLVAVLNQDGLQTIVSGGDEAALSAAETTIAASTDADDLAEEADGAGSDGESLAGATTSTIADAGVDDQSAPTPPEAVAYYSAQADELRLDETPETRSFGGVSSTELGACLREAGLVGFEVLEANPRPGEEDAEVPEEAVPYVVAIPFEADVATTDLVFVSLETCEVIHIDG